ncbi:MAG: hypothetical protein P4L40_06635 [Terracidiphilus sp.]|nr:hypothetical protein [Terracidiphilus sp.]
MTKTRMRMLLGLTGIVLACCAAPAAARHKKAADAAANKPAVMASQPAAFSIPVDGLGFSAPGAFYEGQRERLVSLDFVDEDRLLFTFHAPGLLHRSAAGGDKPKQIRAVLLALPKGTVEAEELWTIHGGGRYLWMLGGGRFLLRDGDLLKQGDATLDLKPLLHFPGPLEWLEMDPAQQYLVTGSREPANAKAQAGTVPIPATAAANVEQNEARRDDAPEIVLRILRRTSGQVMLVSRVRTAIHLPISEDGYLEPLHTNAREWMLNLNYFTGGSRLLGRVPSTCSPPLEFLSRDAVLANTCLPQGGRDLIALGVDGRRLWDAPAPPTQVWPLLVASSGGTRLARETLTVSHAVETMAPLSFDDVTGQLVEVFDTATGRTLLKAPASPVLDGGGNVALSPSGRWAAVLNGSLIEVYDLTAAAGQGAKGM